MIRRATELDLFRLLRLAQKYREESKGYENHTIDETFAVTNAALSILDPNQCIFVAVARQEVVGLIWGLVTSLVWSPKKIAMDQMLYVLPEYRGRLGVRLIKTYLGWAKEVGAEEVFISSASRVNEDRTFRLFERLGFNQHGRQYRKEL